MTRPDTWPFDKFLREDETIIWSQRANRPPWGRIFGYYLTVPWFFVLLYILTVLGALSPSGSAGLDQILLTTIAWVIRIYVGYKLAYFVIQIPRSFFYHYALTNQRMMIVNTFIWRTKRVLPPRWMHPDLIYVTGKDRLHLPCIHEEAFCDGTGRFQSPGPFPTREARSFVHTQDWRHRTCQACRVGNHILTGVAEPERVANLIKATLSPLQQADQKAWEDAHPDYD